MESPPPGDEIEVAVSAITEQWTYRILRSGIDRCILDGCDLQFDATVPIEGTPRSERWRIGVRCVESLEAEALQKRLLGNEISRLEIADGIVGLRVFAGEVHVSRGFDAGEIQKLAEAIGREFRHMETTGDGTSVDLLTRP